MNQRATIGVLITYYNEAGMLTECLESLRGADFPDEILVYDDASSLPASDYIPSGMQVRVIRGETNRGPSYGRNQLLNVAQTEYIHFHDADDPFLPEWCRTVRRTAEQKAPDAIFTEVASYRDGKLVSPLVVGFDELRRHGDLLKFALLNAILVTAGTYRTSVVRELGGYSEALWQSEDYYFSVKLALKGIRYEIIPQALVTLRQRADSRSQKRAEVWISTLQGIEMFAGEIPQSHRSFLAQAAARTGSILFQLGAEAEARRAFELAALVDPEHMPRRGRLYRSVAQWFGPMVAERLGYYYRKFVPDLIVSLQTGSKPSIITIGSGIFVFCR